MSLLTSKVIQNPFRSQKCPPRLLGGCSGDSKENVLFHWTEGPEILYIAYLMFIHVSFGVQIHIHYTQEERISSKTPWRIIWRLIGECPLPVNLKAFKFAQSCYIYNSWCPNSSRLHSGMKNVLQDFLVDALETHRRISSFSSSKGTELPKGL